MTLDFKPRSHAASDWLNEFLHGDQTHEDEDGNEVTNPGTPGPVVVIEPEPEPDPDPPNANPGPAPAPEPEDEQKTLSGDSGNNILIGGDNHDTLYGAAGHDLLIGGPGRDSLTGSTGNNILDGGPGNDYLESEGNDVLIGGPGRDVFVLWQLSNKVKIMDFEDGADTIKIEFPSGVLPALYTMAQEAGLTWDMEWIATEVDGGVIVDWQDGTADSFTLTVLGAEISDFQTEIGNNGASDELWIT